MKKDHKKRSFASPTDPTPLVIINNYVSRCYTAARLEYSLGWVARRRLIGAISLVDTTLEGKSTARPASVPYRWKSSLVSENSKGSKTEGDFEGVCGENLADS